ncbi:Uncharacterised protein [Streptococcus pneumoniae]|nr:Uncharacterised protein [Streptococcus pneumoniae]
MFKSHSLGEKKVQYCVKVDDTYIGVIDYSVQEERAVLSQLIIHFDYQGYGYGTNTYDDYLCDTINIRQVDV